MLDDWTVIDLTQGVAGPLCARNLGHMGAKIVKVERPGQGDVVRNWDTIAEGHSSGHAWVNVNKRSVVIDLGSNRGLAVLDRLLDHERTIVVHNFLPSTATRIGVSGPQLTERFPRLIVGEISGFGWDETSYDRRAIDMIVQGETGVLLTNGTDEQPAKISLSVCDLAAGMYLTIGVQNAVLRATTSGQGSIVRVSLFDAIMAWTGYFPYMVWYRDENPRRVGLDHHTIAPYGVFPTADGDIVVVGGSGGDTTWQNFCAALDAPELSNDARLTTNEGRIAHADELRERISAHLAGRRAEEWVVIFNAAAVPCGVVRSLDAALQLPAAKRLTRTVRDGDDNDVPYLDYPVRDDRDAPGEIIGPPFLGEHTVEVLREFQFSDEEIDKLVADTVVVSRVKPR